MSAVEKTCEHNWITPPECPQCCSNERDALQSANADLKASLGMAISLLENVGHDEDAPLESIAAWDRDFAKIKLSLAQGVK